MTVFCEISSESDILKFVRYRLLLDLPFQLTLVVRFLKIGYIPLQLETGLTR